jgi:hypothetical protein
MLRDMRELGAGTHWILIFVSFVLGAGLAIALLALVAGVVTSLALGDQLS